MQAFHFLHCHVQYGRSVACTLLAVDAVVTSKSSQGEPANHVKLQRDISSHVNY